MNKMTIPIASKIDALRQNEMTMLKTNSSKRKRLGREQDDDPCQQNHAPVDFTKTTVPAMPSHLIGMPQICLMTPAFHNQIPSSAAKSSTRQP